MRILIALGLALTVTGCSLVPESLRPRPKPAAEAAASDAVAPVVVPSALRPANARTADQFDTTTAAERAAAQAKPAAPAERKLGATIASLGDPTAPGFWLETPLVDTVRQGRVVNPRTGASVQVELRPISGGAGAGSRISLAAMRLLGVALTELAEVEVFAG